MAAGFWSQAIEPMRKNRWTITFTNRAGLVELTYALKKVDKPSYKTTDITHKFGNYSYYYPGRVEWNTINMTFASIADTGGVRGVDSALLDTLQGGGVGAPSTQEVALSGIAKSDIAGAIGDIIITQLSADGATPIETWTLVNPFFTNIKFGDLSYESEEIVDVECTVRFDWAKFSDGS